MAEPISSRLFTKNRHHSNKKAGRQPYSGPAQYVEGRAWLVAIRSLPLMLNYLKIEFYLVAGGEELLLEIGMSGVVKLEEGGDMPLDCDENDAPSSHSA